MTKFQRYSSERKSIRVSSKLFEDLKTEIVEYLLDCAKAVSSMSSITALETKISDISTNFPGRFKNKLQNVDRAENYTSGRWEPDDEWDDQDRFERQDDYNVWEENQLDLDRAMGEYDE